jgi:outer membrane protein assembly factor BamB
MEGKKVWTFPTGGPLFIMNPLFLEKRIFFGSWDCNMYCIDEDGRLVWKSPTSIGNPSRVDIQIPEKKASFEVVWEAEESSKEKKDVMPEEDISDYGEMKSTYVDSSNQDYAGGFGRKGYR